MAEKKSKKQKVNDCEVWKSIPGANEYLVSESGRVIKLTKKGRKKVTINKSGRYYTVVINCKPQYVHRLVNICFNGLPYDDSLQTNHIDGDKTNNHYSNLEWVTQSENLKHAHTHKLIKATGRKLNKQKAKKIKRLLKVLTQKEIAEMFEVSEVSINLISIGKTYSDVVA